MTPQASTFSDDFDDPLIITEGMRRLTKKTSGFCPGRSKRNRMICLPGRGRNRLIP